MVLNLRSMQYSPRRLQLGVRSSFDAFRSIHDALRRPFDAFRSLNQAVRRPYQGVRSSYQGIIFSSDAQFYWAEYKNSGNKQNLRFVSL
jgi:hypothetical protein